jgi:hypothetical protein
VQLNRIESVVTKAVRDAMFQMKQEAEQEYMAARVADRKARKAKARNGQRWIENYPLSIVRSVEYERENADIVVDGAPVIYQVREEHSWNHRNKRTWSLRAVFNNPDVSSEHVKTGEDFESLIQYAVVMAVGAAYYGGHIETPATPGRK